MILYLHSKVTLHNLCFFLFLSFASFLTKLMFLFVCLYTEKICKEHEQCFPSFGNITISALKVTMFSSYTLTVFLFKKQQLKEGLFFVL